MSSSTRLTKGAGGMNAVQYDAGVLGRRTVVTLSAAQILGMFAAAVVVLPAPLAGRALLVYSILFEMLPTATQYASGGVVTFQYSGGAVVHATSIPAAVVNAAATSYTALFSATPANGLTLLAATAITVSNATGAFTTGTGTARIVVNYDQVTL